MASFNAPIMLVVGVHARSYVRAGFTQLRPDSDLTFGINLVVCRCFHGYQNRRGSHLRLSTSLCGDYVYLVAKLRRLEQNLLSIRDWRLECILVSVVASQEFQKFTIPLLFSRRTAILINNVFKFFAFDYFDSTVPILKFAPLLLISYLFIYSSV